MFEGNRAIVKMKSSFLIQDFFDDKAHDCKVIKYDENEDKIYLVSRDYPIHLFSLDCIYECAIWDIREIFEADGIIMERYRNHEGEVLVLEVKNGFYKKAIK